jgi:uncharacterized protein YwqG
MAFFVIVHSLDRFVWAPKRRREAEAAPRITLAEAQSFWQAIEADTLPIATAVLRPRPPQSPQESRIGGAPLAIGKQSVWPRNRSDGFPMVLIAQINFSEVLEIKDFPTHGVLQIFSSLDMIDESGGCERVIRWDPDPHNDELMDIPEELKKTTRQTRDFSEKARRVGLPLLFERGVALGNPHNWPFAENDLCYENRLPENDAVAAIMEDWEDRSTRIVEGYKDHWVGGHPSFVQVDVRSEHPELQNLDRVLFHLGCDDEINLGDSGELNVLISRQALLQRDFQKTYLTWDCC